MFLEQFINKYFEKLKKAAPRFELGIKDLQSSALPLGHAAVKNSKDSPKYFTSRKSIYLLIICNGHGEDLIALEIIKKLIILKSIKKIEVLPLVGNGHIFDSINSKAFSKIGTHIYLPSGGFSNQSLKGLFRDLRAGLLLNLIRNWFLVREKSKKDYKIIAIGDLLPLYFAWSSKCVFGFIGTPKSDHTWTSGPGKEISDFYHKLKGSEWDPWEIFLMMSQKCKFVIVRDKLTAKNLNLKNINAKYFGNPMMDFIKEKKLDQKNIASFQKLIMLIGSRMPEALDNLDIFLSCLSTVNLPSKTLVLVPLSSNLDVGSVEDYFCKYKYYKEINKVYNLGEKAIWMKNNIVFLIGKNTFDDWANLAQIGLANAGTATEQIAGLGVPSLSLPGKGPQFTKKFAKRQQRLLGGSVIVCLNQDALKKKLIDLFLDKEMRKKQAIVGLERMGQKGASQKIVEYIDLNFLS